MTLRSFSAALSIKNRNRGPKEAGNRVGLGEKGNQGRWNKAERVKIRRARILGRCWSELTHTSSGYVYLLVYVFSKINCLPPHHYLVRSHASVHWLARLISAHSPFNQSWYPSLCSVWRSLASELAGKVSMSLNWMRRFHSIWTQSVLVREQDPREISRLIV